MNDLQGARFPKRLRLRSSSEFRRVFDRRISAADNMLIVYAAVNDLAATRLGLSVSRKVGNAVTRNRWKRHIREAFRLSHGQLPIGIDIVVLPRRHAEPSFGAVRRSLLRLTHKLDTKLRSGVRDRSARPSKSNLGTKQC